MRIVATIGDCNGIGPEVLLKALGKADFLDAHEVTIAGNSRTIAEYIAAIGFDAEVSGTCLRIRGRNFPVLECSTYSELQLGSENQSGGRLAAEALELAVAETKAAAFDALVTMPVSKNALMMAGWTFPGQTEMLALRCGVANPMMILCTRTVRVALATIHVPLIRVPGLISRELVVEKIITLRDSLMRDFACREPRIAILGLNPHAGENGHMGMEEQELIFPAIEEARTYGIDASGPWPADGFFAHGSYRNYDGILAMYHDQGLIPLKLLANGGGVNMTAGLPIVRTSPDHGTAFAIAGRNIADETSAVEAFEQAVAIVESRKIFSNH